MERKRLLRSQKILLQMRSKEVQEAINLVQARQKEVQATLKLAMTEQGVPKDELNLWQLSEDGQAIEKIEMPEPQKDKKDKDKGGK